MRRFLSFVIMTLLLVSCYQQEKPSVAYKEMTKAQKDSVRFFEARHYAHDYNFRVKADSLQLMAIPNPMDLKAMQTVDYLTVEEGDRLVVGNFIVMPTDTVDSVWVQVLRDEETIGWIHEKTLLEGVVPNNPITLFIDFFSNSHLLVFLAFLVVVSALYAIRRYHRKDAPIVHFNDIASLYPTVLTILVSSAAVFYSTIQLFATDAWVQFYYHPTLNPFNVTPLIGIFLASVWAILIVAIATLVDIRKYVSPADQFIYYLGLLSICAVDYVVFSVSTLYYIGYPLLVAYIIFALWRFFKYGKMNYICGNCGKPMRQKGKCPHCGAMNI